MKLRRAARVAAIATIAAASLTAVPTAYAKTISGPPQTIHIDECYDDDSCLVLDTTTKLTINKNVTMRRTEYTGVFYSNLGCGGADGTHFDGKTFTLSRNVSGQVVNQRFTDHQAATFNDCEGSGDIPCDITLNYKIVNGRVLIDSRTSTCPFV